MRGRASIADLFPGTRRCGIYILHFTNGEMYVGQAIDVTRRYVQHCCVHDDIESLAFKRVPQGLLNDEERGLIRKLESDGHRLRNITFTALPRAESDFDLIMSAEEQTRWLHDFNVVDLSGVLVSSIRSFRESSHASSTSSWRCPTLLP